MSKELDDKDQFRRPPPKNKKNVNFEEKTENKMRPIAREKSDEDIADTAEIFLRLRPMTLPSVCYNVSDCNKVLTVCPTASGNKNCSAEQAYRFSEIFNKHAAQSEVYNKIVMSKIDAEESFSLLTYGTSGSGKTFTFLGTANSPGILPRALEHIFHKYSAVIFPMPNFKLVRGVPTIMDDEAVHREEVLSRNLIKIKDADEFQQLTNTVKSEHDFGEALREDVSVWVWVSFVEIYNENVYDLIDSFIQNSKFQQSASSMHPPTRNNLQIICNDGKVLVKNIMSVYVKSSGEAISVLRTCLKRVNYAATSVNQNSNRSHCVFIVDVLKFFRSGITEKLTYKFGDLAGSERLNKTKNVGARLKEAQQINKSLLVLGRCLDVASNRKKPGDVMPFRESKLTMLFQTALQGREKMAMIVNLMPADDFYEENMNVLNFASIAKDVTFRKPKAEIKKMTRFSFVLNVPKNHGDDSAGSQLQQEIIELRQENQILLQRVTEVLVEKEDALLALENQKREYESKLQSMGNAISNYVKLLEKFQGCNLNHGNTSSSDASASVSAFSVSSFDSTEDCADNMAFVHQKNAENSSFTK